MLARWNSVETILLSTAPPGDKPIFPVISLCTPGDVQRPITDDYHWIRIKLGKISNKVSKRPYKETTLTQSRFVYFLDVRRTISLYKN